MIPSEKKMVTCLYTAPCSIGYRKSPQTMEAIVLLNIYHFVFVALPRFFTHLNSQVLQHQK